MPYPTATVRERILRQIKAALTTAFGSELGAANIQRFDGKNNKIREKTAGVLPVGFIVITATDDEIDNEEATSGLTFKIMPVTVDFHIVQPPPGSGTLDEYGNVWAGRLEEVLMADENWTENTTEEELASDTLVTDVFYPEPADGQRDAIAGVTIEVHYDHIEGDPSSRRGG